MKNKATINRIKKAIIKSGLRKNFIAQQCGIEPCVLSSILSGKREYKKKKALVLDYLGLS